MTRIRRYWTGARKAPAQDRFFVESLDPDLWAQGDRHNWDTCWHTGMPAGKVFREAGPGTSINHIPGNNALTVKSMLYTTLSQAERLASTTQARASLDFFPRSHILPGDYHALQRDALENPQKRWIVKPKRLSRGRGIRVLEDAGEVPLGDDWLVQEYLDRPHLLDGRKYVLRLYLLIASIEPLRVYLYRDGFVKLASEPYSAGDFDNLYAHLTNPDINAHNDKVEAPVVFHSFDDYRTWLSAQGADAGALFERIREMAVICAAAARDQMLARTVKSGASAQACYELIGLDCMVDKDLKPWLLECNLSPSLETCAAPEDGGIYEEATKRGVVEDLVSLLGLNLPERPAHIEPADGEGFIRASAEEMARAGRFERIYPGGDVARFLPFLRAPRFADLMLARAVSDTRLEAPRFAPAQVEEFILDDALALFSERTGRFLSPEAAPAFIWLRASAGAPAEQIAGEMADTMNIGNAPGARQALSCEVVNAVADWVADGLLKPADMPAPDVPPAGRQTTSLAGGQDWIEWAGKTVLIRWSAPEIGARIADLASPLRTPSREPDSTLHLIADTPGYALATQDTLVKTGLKLNELASALRDTLLGEWQAAHPDMACLNASCLRIDGELALFANGRANQWDAPSLLIAQQQNAEFLGACAQIAEAGSALPLVIAGRVAADSLTALSMPGGQTPCWQAWPGCERGAYVGANKPEKSGTALPVRAIFIPNKVDASGEPATRPLDGLAKLKALASLLRPAPDRPKAPAELFSWGETLDVFELDYTDADQLSGAAASIR
jgi:hypothetical protein